MGRLDGKVFVLSAAAQGIGKAAALVSIEITINMVMSLSTDSVVNS